MENNWVLWWDEGKIGNLIFESRSVRFLNLDEGQQERLIELFY